MPRGKTPESVGESNRMLILNYLRLYGSMSRADLCRNLEISFPAISSNVKNLLETDYIKEVGQGDNSIGRKSTLLSFNQFRGYVLGIDLGRFWVRITVADLSGEPIASEKRKTDSSNSGRKMIEEMVELIHSVLRKAEIDQEKVLCICIGLPGVIRQEEILLAPFLPDFSIKDLKDAVSKEFRTEIIVENSINLGAIGEKWKGAGKKYKNFAFINYGVGVGAAFIIEGELYRGANNAAGEIGFMVSDQTKLREYFEEIGVLENTIARDKIQECISHGDFQEEVSRLIEQYREKDEKAMKILNEIFLSIGMALINISAFLDLEAIIISGGLGIRIGKLFADQWKVLLENHVPFPPKILFSSLDNQEGVMGAISVGIENLHKNPETEF